MICDVCLVVADSITMVAFQYVSNIKAHLVPCYDCKCPNLVYPNKWMSTDGIGLLQCVFKIVFLFNVIVVVFVLRFVRIVFISGISGVALIRDFSVWIHEIVDVSKHLAHLISTLVYFFVSVTYPLLSHSPETEIHI